MCSLLSIIASTIYTADRFLSLIVQDGQGYWVTVQSTDPHGGIIILSDGVNYNRYQDSGSEFLVYDIIHLNYRVPLKKWGTQVIVRVYSKKPILDKNMFGAIDATATEHDKNKAVAQANLVQDDGADWITTFDYFYDSRASQNKLKYAGATIPNSNIDLPIRIFIKNYGSIHLLTT